jgi:xanthine dehydrogenase YagT iron-sulfur-binding subunit
MIEVRTRVNGVSRDERVRANGTLLDHLRDRLQLKGTVEGCGVGMCGACTVLVDGEPMTSCLMLAADIDGREITTIEGLDRDGSLDPVQAAFLEQQAFQCGYCTPGMVLAVKGLISAHPAASEAQVRDYLSGNLCRCGTYAEVIAAALSIGTKE